MDSGHQNTHENAWCIQTLELRASKCTMHIVLKKNIENMGEERKEERKGLLEWKSIEMLNLAS